MTKLRVAALALAAGVVVGACGGGGGADTSSGQDGLGAPGNPANARTVEIRAGNDLRFQPDNVQVKVGETVTFHVVNTATVEHDFTLGDEDEQAAHEKEMRSMSSSDGHMHEMGDSANAIHIPPGQSKDLTWKFTKAGTTLYGCHEPGHYDSGMKGTITVS